jgi:ATP synthase protein I
MPNDTPERGRNGADSQKRSSEEAALSARLERLDHRLAEKRHDRADQIERQGGTGETTANRASAMARGFRLSSELVAGVVVGALIGWGIDKLLSTSPFGLILFFLLGFAAGVINLMRAAGVAPSAYERLKEPDQKN